MKKRARLKDIAEALNLSITTVSRALNDKSDISQKTKNTVIQVAKMMDYKPNYFAKFLLEDKNNIIGVIVPEVAHYFFSSIIDGALKTAQENGYFVIVAESFDDGETEKAILQKFLNLNVEGIILAPAQGSPVLYEDYHNQLDAQKIVLVDRSDSRLPFDQITNNHYDGAMMALVHLKEQGYEHIAHVAGVPHDIIGGAILKAYKDFCEKNENTENYISTNHVSPEVAYNGMTEIMKRNPETDAVFAVSDKAALGVYRYCHEHKKQVAQDIGIVGFSDNTISKYLAPSLTTISQDSFQMGVYGAERLMMDDKQKDRTIKLFNTKLVIRESSIKPK